MPEQFYGNFYLVLATMVFIAVILFIEGGYLLWRGHKGPAASKLTRRLQALSAAGDSSQQSSVVRERLLSDLPFLNRVLLQLPRAHTIDRYLLQADLQWTVSRLIITCCVCSVLAYFATDSLTSLVPLLKLIFAGFAGALPALYVISRRARRLKHLERQLPDALDLLTRAIRSGHAFSSALKMIGEEMVDPIAGEFAFVHDEINYGVTLEQALNNLGERVPITDLRYFIIAVIIQRESGGNLAEVLTNLSRLIRARLKLMDKVKVLSSEGRMSGWILSIMPFFMAGLLTVVNPEFMKPFFSDPIGITIIQYLAVMMFMGMMLIRKIIRIHV